MADRVEVVGQEPLGRTGSAHLAVILAQRIRIRQVALGQCTAAVEIHVRIRPVVDRVQGLRPVQRDADAVADDVVGERLVVEYRAVASDDLYLRETVLVVPGIIRHRAGGNVGLRQGVAVLVVGVVVRPVAQQLVARAGGVGGVGDRAAEVSAGAGAIAVGIIIIRYTISRTGQRARRTG